jgi:IS4 transposase
VRVVDAHGDTPIFRRLRITLKDATRDGATIIHLLTKVPRQVSATRVAARSRKRWTRETAFQPLEAALHSAINTLGSPTAALFGFCLALVAYNVLAVVLAALRGGGMAKSAWMTRCRSPLSPTKVQRRTMA